MAGEYDGVLAAVSVYPTPIMSIERPENVAMPPTTATAEPPVSVPPPGFVPMARLTVVVWSPVSTLPLASSTATVTGGVMAEPAAVFVGTLDEDQLRCDARGDVEG